MNKYKYENGKTSAWDGMDFPELDDGIEFENEIKKLGYCEEFYYEVETLELLAYQKEGTDEFIIMFDGINRWSLFYCPTFGDFLDCYKKLTYVLKTCI